MHYMRRSEVQTLPPFTFLLVDGIVNFIANLINHKLNHQLFLEECVDGIACQFGSMTIGKRKNEKLFNDVACKIRIQTTLYSAA